MADTSNSIPAPSASPDLFEERLASYIYGHGRGDRVMATQPTTTTSVAALPNIIAPMPAVARILSRYDRPKLAAFIAIAIDLLDTIDGDVDNEDSDPTEANGDEHDCAATEWHGLNRRSQRSGAVMSIDPLNRNIADEEREEDDPAGQYDEDYYTGRPPRGHGPGCAISDPDFCRAGDDRGMGIE